MTVLQNQGFKVNSNMFHFLKDKKDSWTENGLLMPAVLASVKPHVVYDILREELAKEENKGKYKFTTIVDILDKRIQQARF